jgi:hypothetical protein
MPLPADTVIIPKEAQDTFNDGIDAVAYPGPLPDVPVQVK